MERKISFAGVEPVGPKQYAEPQPPARAAKLVWAGPSELGSHAMRLMTGCARAIAIGHPEWTNPAGLRASTRTGDVRVLPDLSTAAIFNGPATAEDAVGSGGATVYMIRGTLAHVALAHELVAASLARGEAIAVAGNLVEDEPPANWYTAAEAIEVAATLVGSSSFTFALPAARRLLGPLRKWVADLLDRERVLAIETQLVWHLDAPFAYTARLDLATRNRASDLIYSWDYKTTADPQADKRKRYATAAQLMGQDQMGQRWAGSKWGGVKLLLIGDRGGDSPTTLEEWAWPRNPRGRDLEHGIAAAQNAAAPFVGHPVREWPTNPLFCSGCGVGMRNICYSI